MCTRESGILWAFRRRLTPKAYITLSFDPMESMYSRSTWAQQQGSGRLVARIVYNPISTSLRLVIDPLHGWSVLSALAFESGQWPRERKEEKKSDCWLCNPEYPENCMSPFSNICRPRILITEVPTPIKSSFPSSNTRTNPPVLYLITCVRNEKFPIVQVKKPRIFQVPNLLSPHPHFFPPLFFRPPLLHANLAITPELSFLTV